MPQVSRARQGREGRLAQQGQLGSADKLEILVPQGSRVPQDRQLLLEQQARQVIRVLEGRQERPPSLVPLGLRALLALALPAYAVIPVFKASLVPQAGQGGLGPVVKQHSQVQRVQQARVVLLAVLVPRD